MINYYQADPWKIIENSWNADKHEISESIFSIGNGMMGQRANFEETYTGQSLQGTYLGGVYFPDKTRVGWWKNGYPEYFAKVINSPNWLGMEIKLNGEILDLSQVKIISFYRELDMQHGILSRKAQLSLNNGLNVEIHSKRFYNLVNKEHAAFQYQITCDKNCEMELLSFVDADIKNKDSNYEEKFWEEIGKEMTGNFTSITARTTKLNWHACIATQTSLFENEKEIQVNWSPVEKIKFAGIRAQMQITANQMVCIEKQMIASTSFHHPEETVTLLAKKNLGKIGATGFQEHALLHSNAWLKKWEQADVQIEGDVKAQQAVRFNIFQLNQTYCGDDARLNIGPKGYTGEKYGGSTYWDTEAYCLPFYLYTADSAISKQLLMYRYKQLNKAIENAQKLGFSGGAALYPMVTMNGEECHNEWEITFEEIHRNGAIVYAIYNYVQHTGDWNYVKEFGIEVIVAVAKFWAQRVHWVERKNRFEMHGVTGPNEYENNVNNNWYTNFLAKWCLKYAKTELEQIEKKDAHYFSELYSKLELSELELQKWNKIIDKIYLPFDADENVFVQHDGFMEKELIPVSHLDVSQRPINQKWSWDRILRSVYIKQADVLQGLYFFENEFDVETIKRNFDFYEPFTVHESSLSPCIHSILACRIQNYSKAYEMYMRTARLDLDNYNNDTEDGLHITSMAGSYLSIVQGFGGVRVYNQKLILNPSCPNEWKSYSFNILVNSVPLFVTVNKQMVKIENLGNSDIEALVLGKNLTLNSGVSISLQLSSAASS